MKICVLLPDYSTTSVDYQYYDQPRDHLGSLIPGSVVDTVFLNKLTTYRQLKQLSAKNYDVFVNLCEGYLDWEVPSIDVIYFLELLQLPFTGPVSRLYDPPKSLMKYVAFCEGVNTPAYVVAAKPEDVQPVPANLKFPLFVKPAHAGDSLGVDEHSLVHNGEALTEKVKSLLVEYPEVLIEEYIEGREFTVLVAANASPENTNTVFKPVEYNFPPGYTFKTYALKTRELHPDANIPCNDPVLDDKLRRAAAAIFKSFNGKGYARLDFRVDAGGEIYFLEINFTCSVFYKDGYEGSADFILKFDGIGQDGFLKHIIEEGIARYNRVKRKYYMKGDSIAGYGIHAAENIKCNELIFKGEERPQRIVTRNWMERNWNDVEKENFRRYAYPVSKEVFLLWDDDPDGWAPQNHSCMPNTAYDGLNVVALRDIQKDEELTLDYTSFLDEHAQPFHCQCGTPNCRKWISGTTGNTITYRESLRG